MSVTTEKPLLARMAFIAFLWQQFARVSEYLVQLVTFKLTALAIGPTGGGMYATIGVILGLGLNVIQLGFEESANNFGSRFADSPGKLSFLIRSLFVRRLALAIFAGAVLYFAAPLLARHQSKYFIGYYHFAAIILILNATSSLLSYFTLALFENRNYVMVRIPALFIQVGSLVWFFNHHYAVQGALMAQAVSAGFMLIGFTVLAIRHALPKPEPVPLKPILNFGFVLGFQNLMNFALGKSLDILVLSVFSVSFTLRGYYNAVFNLRFLVDTFFIMGMSASALAATARLAETGGAAMLPKAWYYNLKATTLLSVPPAIFMILHTRAGISVLSSREFLSAENVCRVLLFLGMIARSFGGGASSTVLAAAGKERLVLRQFLIGGVANVVLDLLLVPIFKAINPGYALFGVAIGTGISAIVTSWLGFRAVKNAYNVHFPFMYTLKVIGASFIATLATLPLVPPHTQMTKLGITLLPSTAIFLMIFVMLLRVLRPFELKDVEVADRVGKKMAFIVRIFAREVPDQPLSEAAA